MKPDQIFTEPSATNRWYRRPELAVLFLLVGGIYFARMTALPEVGEETRWACAAREMLMTGDWIVVRQQGEVFPERPPMSVWAMAVVGLVRGEVDSIAVRLPSAMAILLTVLVIYVYASHFLTRFGAFAAAAVFATLGQVLQIGRHGESEAVFTLFLGSSLLLWHLGYTRKWPLMLVWLPGYGLAALAALTKGPQAPLYFAAVTWGFLLFRRDWRSLLCLQHVLGAAAFLTIVLLWQIPYLNMTDRPTTLAVWAGLAGDRIGVEGLISHLVGFPLEVLQCLLPWSVFFLVLLRKPAEQTFRGQREMLTFVLLSVLVTFPSLWFAVGAKSRYFMPLFPCLAVFFGLLVDRCASAAQGTWERNSWNRFLIAMGLIVLACGVIIPVLSLSPGISEKWQLHQPLGYALITSFISAIAAATIFWAVRGKSVYRQAIAFTMIAVFLGFSYTGTIVNEYRAAYNPLDESVAEAKKLVPRSAQMISFGPAYHRFVYYYGETITQVAWPLNVYDVPPDAEYFCMDRFAQSDISNRPIGRGRSWWLVPRDLPFEWEEVALIPCGRLRDEHSRQRTVVIGRIIRPGTLRDANAQVEVGSTSR